MSHNDDPNDVPEHIFGDDDDDDTEEVVTSTRNMSISPPATLVFIGNPGVGKSTLINCLMKEAKFRSGLSFGKGLTTVLQREAGQDGNIYIDTPGLADVELRAQAAQEIKTALTSSKGEFKVFFVITLESGRVRPDDKTTMKLVLNAAKSIGTNYSIIISKASENMMTKLTPEARKSLIVSLNDGLGDDHGTSSIFFAKFNSKLDDKDNAVVALDDDLTLFVNTAVRAKQITQVNNIDVPNYDSLLQKLSAELEALRKDRALLQAKMDAQEERYTKLLKSQQEQRKQQAPNPTVLGALNRLVNPFSWF